MSLTAYALGGIFSPVFEVVPEPEFSTWFESLAEPEAEQVASALDVIAAVGTVLRPARVSRVLLWYDGTGGKSEDSWGRQAETVERLGELGWSAELGIEVDFWEIQRASEEWHDLVSFHVDAKRVLESQAFTSRFAKLVDSEATEALLELGRLKERLAAARVQALLRFAAERRRARVAAVQRELRPSFDRIVALLGQRREPSCFNPAGLRLLRSSAARLFALSPEVAAQALVDIAELETRLDRARRYANDDLSKMCQSRAALEESLARVLSLVGLDVLRSESGLRELTITSTSPHLRVLFGLDPVRRRLLAILGEPLIRSYYGDSVRLAERRWAAYCAERDSAHPQ